jgi:hypothetical protein
MFAISFIGLGIGAIILGVNQLLNRKENQNVLGSLKYEILLYKTA